MLYTPDERDTVIQETEFLHKPYPGAFSNTKHYIFVFHDSIFEAAADDAEARTFQGSMEDALDEMVQTMRTNSR